MTPNSSAKAFKDSNILTLFSLLASPNNLLNVSLNDGLLSNLEPYGMLPSLYLPLNKPPLIGDQIVVPYLYLSKMLLYSLSNLSLNNKLY